MEMTRRQARIARIIKQVASRVILYELSDPRIGMVTVTRVEPSRDNRCAKVHVSVMGNPTKVRTSMRGLRGARAVIQAEVAKHLTTRLTTRFTPVLKFVEDDSIKRSIRVSELLRKAREESTSAEGETQGSEEDRPEDDGAGSEDLR